MNKQQSTLTFSKLWTFPWKILTHLSLGAKGLTSQIRTATESKSKSAAEGHRERQPWQTPMPRTGSLIPHSPKATGNQQLSLQEALLWQEFQKTPNLPSQNGAITSSQEASLHPDTSHGHSPEGLSLTEGQWDRQGDSWAVTPAEGTQPSHPDRSQTQSAGIACAMAPVPSALQELGCHPS